MHISLMEVMVVCVIRGIRKCSITIMTKNELGDIDPLSGGGQCTENGTWWWNQRIKKATKAEKDAFMKCQRSR